MTAEPVISEAGLFDPADAASSAAQERGPAPSEPVDTIETLRGSHRSGGTNLNEESTQLALDIEVEEPRKKCRDCRQRFPLDGFNKNRRNAGGYMSVCRSCDNRASRDWRQRNPGYHAAYSAAWRAARNDAEKATVLKVDPPRGDLL